MTDMKYVGANIYQNRKRRRMSQAKLAERVGVSQSLVSYWELGKKTPQPYGLMKFAKVLGVLEDELLMPPKK